MCRNQRTLHTCMHSTTHVTLCEATLAPLIHRATTFPFTGAIPGTRAFAGCDVILCTEQGNGLCPDCVQRKDARNLGWGDLDVWQLGVDSFPGERETHRRPAKERVFVTVDPALCPPAQISNIGKNTLTADPRLQPSHDLTNPKTSWLPAHTEPPSDEAQRTDPLQHQQKRRSTRPRNINVTIAAKPFVPYTGGLGLLVTTKTPTRFQPTVTHKHELDTFTVMGFDVSGDDALSREMQRREELERAKRKEGRSSKL